LGPQVKKVEEHNNLFIWVVGSKSHFSCDGELTSNHLDILKDYSPVSFHYINQSNLDILKSRFKVNKVKNRSIILNIKDFSLDGGKYKSLRQAYNKCGKNNFEILNNFKKIEDVKIMLDDWSTNYTDKYFRDFSGKNLYFYKNNYHKDCINVFVYSGDMLVSFGTLSPNNNGNSTYIIGKALFKKFYGLSEYTDILLYKKALENGIEIINMGQASKGLIFYKKKFPNSIEEIHYDGKIEI
jgi:hypothetical protein